MFTRAMFRVVEKTELHDGYKIKLAPVMGGSEEEKAFFKYTPYGELTLGLIQPETAAKFKVGVNYYIDFSEVVPVIAAPVVVTPEASIGNDSLG